MNKSVNIILAIVGILVIGFGLVYLGFALGRFGWFPQIGPSNAYVMPGHHMMEPYTDADLKGCGFGMMGLCTEGDPNGSSFDMMEGHGMMGGYAFNASEAVEPLTITEVDEAVHEYLENLQDDDLALGEIMIFDNHGYAQIVEKSTGIGAMEVLIDPVTLAVYPEHGPNMMWNLKYSHMGGMMPGHGMMGFGQTDLTAQEAEDMPVSAEEAVETAQQYLDNYFPGTQADDHADPFYGYYTLHTLEDGEVTGMLSVNGFNGQVYLHTWHGDFIEMSAH
jgi:hypothetical protein